VLGIDLGTRRIGVATGDATETLASPLDVVVRSGDLASDHRTIARLVVEAEAELVVVGLPLSLNGTKGPAALAAEAEVEALAAALPVPVEMWDERLTTVSAHRSMLDLQMNGEARRKVVDKVAAAVMLQGWLDARRQREVRP
jgi:putative Holliday junction resolvase